MRRLLLVDWSDESSLTKPDPWWRAAAILFAGMFSKVAHCHTVQDVYDALNRFDPEPGDEVQLWCHGAPGRPVMGGADVDDDHPAWGKVVGAKVWFRACDIARGKAGQAFMNKLAAKGIHVVGHLAPIGPLGHSYLVGVASGETAWWPADFDGQHSGPFKPRTVSAAAMALPSWAFTKTGLK